MKFKAHLMENGVSMLEKRFLPALDKMGRICHVYLTRDHAMFLLNLLNGEGIHSVAQFRKEALFDDYRISSQNEDCIAFSIDLGLLHRAIRSSVAVSTSARGVHIKLVKKVSPTHPMPFLTLETKGYKSALIQDIPISKPLSRSDLLDLQSALQAEHDLPRTLVQVPDMNRIQVFADRIKQVGEVLDVSITTNGDLRLQVSTTLVTLGANFTNLTLVGDANSRPESVKVSLKHFAKGLQCHLAKPDCAFYGIGAHCFTLVFHFLIPGSCQTDKSISLHCRLPVLDPGTS